jgi:hypothetical protein
MIDNIVTSLIGVLVGGGPNAIIAILVLIIALLLMERRRLLHEITRKDDKVEKIVDDYYRGNLTLTEALNSLKTVLYEVRSRL